MRSEVGPSRRRGLGLWLLLALGAMTMVLVVGYGSHHRGTVALATLSRQTRLAAMGSVARSAVAEARHLILTRGNDPSDAWYGQLRTAGAGVVSAILAPTLTGELLVEAGASHAPVVVGDVTVSLAALEEGAGGAWGGDMEVTVRIYCGDLQRTMTSRSSWYLTAPPDGAFPAEVRLSRSALATLGPLKEDA